MTNHDHDERYFTAGWVVGLLLTTALLTIWATLEFTAEEDTAIRNRIERLELQVNSLPSK